MVFSQRGSVFYVLGLRSQVCDWIVVIENWNRANGLRRRRSNCSRTVGQVAEQAIQGIGKAMLIIRRRRSTSLRHRRPASARSSGSRRDPKQPLACSWFTPATKCKLRLLKLDRMKDYLLMEEEFVAGQERLKPQEDKNEEDRSKVDDLRGSVIWRRAKQLLLLQLLQASFLSPYLHQR